jgi:hypothetical protein
MRTLLLAILGLGIVAGCQTQFLGDPHIDPVACQARCAEGHLEMAGMVYLGEYSSACICQVPRPPGVQASKVPDAVAAAPGALGASAGVIMQMRAAQQQNNTWSNPAGAPGGPRIPR